MARRLLFLTALLGGLLWTAPAEAQTVPTVEYTCSSSFDNGPWITNLLINNNVHATGWCAVDFGPLDRNAGFKAGIEITNNRTLDLSGAVVYLRANQSPCKTPEGVDTVQRCDIVTERNAPAQGITILSGTVDGQATSQAGLGYDGVSLRQCLDCTVRGTTVQNVRGLDTAGGPTESFALGYDGCRGNCLLEDVTVKTTNDAQRLQTSSGIGVNGGTGVNIVGALSTKVEGRGLAAWKPTNLTVQDSVFNDTNAHAGGFEFVTDSLIVNTWFTNSTEQGGIQVKDSQRVQWLGVLITGNADYAIGLNGTTSTSCTDLTFNGDAWPGAEGIFRTFNAGCTYDASGLVQHV